VQATHGHGRTSRLKWLRFPRPFRNTGERGQALVEFSLILPIFLLMIFALVDFGRMFFSWQIVTNAAREGARAAAVQGTNAQVQNAVLASFCNPAPSNCALPLGDVSQSATNVQGDRGEPVTVQVSYDFTYVTPIGAIIALIGGGPLNTPTIEATSTMRLE
jgi:Flp pilus assembly protein TadG